MKRRIKYDPRIKYAVQLREPPPPTLEQINKNFVNDNKIIFVSIARADLDETEDGYVKICQGRGYCDYFSPHSDGEPYECEFCVRILPHDPRSSEQILRDIVRKRTKGRH